jgi:hypothetical protein
MVDEMKPDPLVPRPRWPFTRRQIFAQIGIAAVILVSGMGIGTGGTILTLKNRIIWHPRRFDPPPPPIDRWQADYGLTDEQARQAREAFTRSWAATRTIFIEFGQKQQAELAKFAEDMKTILTPEQFQKFESDFKARTEHFGRQRPGWRPGGRPGSPGEHKDGRKDRGSFRGDKGFRPPPDGSHGPEPAPGGKDFPPPPVPEPEPRTE